MEDSSGLLGDVRESMQLEKLKALKPVRWVLSSFLQWRLAGVRAYHQAICSFQLSARSMSRKVAEERICHGMLLSRVMSMHASGVSDLCTE